MSAVGRQPRPLAAVALVALTSLACSESRSPPADGSADGEGGSVSSCRLQLGEPRMLTPNRGAWVHRPGWTGRRLWVAYEEFVGAPAETELYVVGLDGDGEQVVPPRSLGQTPRGNALAVAPLDDGFVIAAVFDLTEHSSPEDATLGENDVYVRSFDAEATPLGPWKRVVAIGETTSDETLPKLSLTWTGEALLVAVTADEPRDFAAALFALDRTGAPIGGATFEDYTGTPSAPPLPIRDAPPAPDTATVAGDGAGAVIVYTTPETTLWARRLSASGSLDGPELRLGELEHEARALYASLRGSDFAVDANPFYGQRHGLGIVDLETRTATLSELAEGRYSPSWTEAGLLLAWPRRDPVRSDRELIDPITVTLHRRRDGAVIRRLDTDRTALIQAPLERVGSRAAMVWLDGDDLFEADSHAWLGFVECVE